MFRTLSKTNVRGTGDIASKVNLGATEYNVKLVQNLPRQVIEKSSMFCGSYTVARELRGVSVTNSSGSLTLPNYYLSVFSTENYFKY